MVTVSNLLQKLRRVNVQEVVVEALINSEDDYVRLQRSQMLEGFNSKGSRIGQYQNPLYKAIKLRQNPKASGFVDLFKKGDFSRAIFTRTDNDGYIVGSEDYKSEMLEKRYNVNGNIFTLAPVNKSMFLEANLYPNTISVVVKKLT